MSDDDSAGWGLATFAVLVLAKVGNSCGLHRRF